MGKKDKKAMEAGAPMKNGSTKEKKKSKSNNTPVKMEMPEATKTLAIAAPKGKLEKGSPPVIHMQVGTEKWNPTKEELQEIADAISIVHPGSRVLVTRMGVSRSY